MIKKINDLLALALLLGVIPGLWLADALDAIDLNGQVNGALIMAWGLVLTFYFRKKPPEGS